MGLDRPLDITVEQHKTVLALLARHLPNTRAWVYGSRVKWTSRPQSDLDLVVFATPEQAGRVSDLREAFEESNLPFRVDLFVWDDVPEQFRKQIEAEHVVLVEIKDSGLPSEWKKHEVKALIEDGALEIGDGYRAKNTEFAGSGVPFARAGNIKNGFQFNDADHFPEANLYRVGDKISKPGDVVFTSKGTVGRFAFVREDTPQFVYSPQLCFWRSREHWLIDPRFLFFWMFSREFFVQFKGVSGQTDMAEYVSLRDQRNMHLTLPPIPEQRAIAHILGTLDDNIELNQRMNRTLEEMARALFKSWFVDFDPVHAKATLKHHATTLPQGGSDWSVQRARAYLDRMDPNIAAQFPDSFADSELGPIPEGWEVRALGECFEVERGLSYKGSALSSFGVPMHNLNSVFEGGGYKNDGIKYYSGDYRPRHVVKPGDVIVANTEQGHDRLLIGFAAIVPNCFGDNGLFSHHIYRVRPKCLAAYAPDFVCRLLNMQAIHDTISGYATGTTVNMLPVDALKIPRFAAPPLQFVTTFSSIAEEARVGEL